MAKTNGTAQAKTTKSQEAEKLPLFFKNPVPLDLNRHADAALTLQDNMGFAADANSIFLNTVEFAEACKHYPIVFSGSESPMPAVITGLEQSNYFVGKDKQWKQDIYVPAYVRRYPFVFMHVTETDQFVLCVDEDAEQFQKKAGKDSLPLYANGKPSELAINALNFCSAFQQQIKITEEFCAALNAEGLLSPTRSDAKLPNGREIKLVGFQIIDEAKFNQLPEAKIVEFHKKGWLPLIYFALLSASNWRNLIGLAAEAEKK